MDYEINANTLAIMSLNENTCKVIEDMDMFLLNCNSFQVIERSCEYFGSTLEGRKIGTKNLIGVTHKQPIIIEESTNIIFFPLISPNNPLCTWISFNNILKYEKGKDSKKSIIYFKNGQQLEVPISIGSLTNQIFRSSRLQVVLTERIFKKSN